LPSFVISFSGSGPHGRRHAVGGRRSGVLLMLSLRRHAGPPNSKAAGDDAKE